MSQQSNPAPTPASVTGRRRRFNGAHPYPALPQSRLPLLRGVMWVAWAGFLALLDTIRDLIPGNRRARRASAAERRAAASASARAPRVPSLTPTG